MNFGWIKKSSSDKKFLISFKQKKKSLVHEIFRSFIIQQGTLRARDAKNMIKDQL